MQQHEEQKHDSFVGCVVAVFFLAANSVLNRRCQAFGMSSAKRAEAASAIVIDITFKWQGETTMGDPLSINNLRHQFENINALRLYFHAVTIHAELDYIATPCQADPRDAALLTHLPEGACAARLVFANIGLQFAICNWRLFHI